ncbi:MAG TPA: efflux RND transporter periplasmic adaptor subunit [Rhizomicrobium sp.]|jgi:cobalt-zinc-cadmium efflux system membrane fusion protein|nr:efflux RND transporter periplasmic adaptor subunit [Rhizomicrobium sp.]
MTKRFLAAAMAASLVAIAGCSPKSGAEAPRGQNVTLTQAQLQKVTLFTVARASYRRTVDTTGIVDFDNDQASPVLAPFSGPVSRLLVQPGDKVKKGDALAAVVSPDFATAVSTYRKALVTAENARRLADLDKDLLAHQGVSAREEEQAQTDAASAEADRDAALQSLQSLNVAPQVISDTQAGKPTARVEGLIRSPITGTVVERLINPGQLLQAATTNCFTIADLSRVWVMAHIFDSDLGSVHVGDPAQVSTGLSSQQLEGTVENIAAEVDPNTRSVAVRVTVRNPGDFLKRQMYVQVHIRDSRADNGLLVPVSAVLRDEENLPFVYVMQSDGSFARRHVTLGNRSADRYDIPNGLRPGERIVADGAIFVQFMQNQ